MQKYAFFLKLRLHKRLKANTYKMIIFKKASDISRFIAQKKGTGISIGLIPTMGALHAGHIALILASKNIDDLAICSIFVNPTQFNDKKDFEKYPSTIEADINMLEKAGCDVLFLPGIREIYPGGTSNEKKFDLGYLETILEGTFRPGHFQGVCQVVYRLLTIIPAARLYLGRKDYQQCMVLQKMISGMHFKIEMIICPTMREKDGLAMSSRNMRLTETERKQAVKIFETLSFIKKELRTGYLEDLKERARQYLAAEGFKVDYVEIANAITLEPMENNDGNMPLVALIAAFINGVRLIDNMVVQE